MGSTTAESHESGDQGTPPVLVSAFRERMKEVGLDHVVDEAFRMFVRNAPKRIERLREALAGGDPAATEASAHALRSSSLNIWAMGLAGLLSRLESAAEATDLELAGGLLASVEDELDRVLAFLSAVLAGEG